MNEGTINAEVTMGGAVGALLVNRYRVLKQLGQGGMGSVWLAEDTKLDGRKVAVKMLPSILVSNKRAYAQVKQEALVSLKLTHPNIVAVRAFEEEGGTPFLVMDYIEGRTLDDYLAEKGKLTEEETIRLLKPIAAALDYAHAQDVVHRDVKPGNVMIDGSGHSYVLDFGIAREVQETMTRVTGKLSSGTLMYMSPEQLHGAAPKPAQDVYSFAAMAYESLTGTPPFSRGQIEYQIEHDTPEPLPRHIAICRGVMAGLAKAPEARPATCAAVLEKGAKSQGADGGTSTGKTRIAVVLLGVLALGALVGGGWWVRKTQWDAEVVRKVEVLRTASHATFGHRVCCKDCSGTGWRKILQNCSACNGEGLIWKKCLLCQRIMDKKGNFVDHVTRCPRCKGDGKTTNIGKAIGIGILGVAVAAIGNSRPLENFSEATKDACETCHGNGVIACPICSGTGKLTCSTCNTCGGVGKIESQVLCKTCDSLGSVEIGNVSVK